MGGKEVQQIYSEVEKINNYIEGNGTLGKDKPRKDTPYKIKINTNYVRNNTTQDRGENNQRAEALTPEILRNYQSPDTIEQLETWEIEEDSLVESLDDSRDSDLFYYNSAEEQSLNVRHTEKVNTQCTICCRRFHGISIYGYALHLESCSKEHNTNTVSPPSQQSVCELCNKSYKIGDSYKFGHQFVCETCYKYHKVGDNYNKHIKICKCKGVICICKV